MQTLKARDKTTNFGWLFDESHCVSKFLRAITISPLSSRFRTVWQLQKGTEIPSPTRDLGDSLLFPSKTLRFVGARTETSCKITFFVRLKFVSSSMARVDYKEHLFKAESLTILICEIHTLYIARIIRLPCYKIDIFADMPKRWRSNSIPENTTRYFYSRNFIS